MCAFGHAWLNVTLQCLGGLQGSYSRMGFLQHYTFRGIPIKARYGWILILYTTDYTLLVALYINTYTLYICTYGLLWLEFNPKANSIQRELHCNVGAHFKYIHYVMIWREWVCSNSSTTVNFDLQQKHRDRRPPLTTLRHKHAETVRSRHDMVEVIFKPKLCSYTNKIQKCHHDFFLKKVCGGKTWTRWWIYLMRLV